MRKVKLPAKRSVVEFVKKHKVPLSIFAGGLSGALLLTIIWAAPSVLDFETENQSSTVTGPAYYENDLSASGSRYIKFGSGSSLFKSHCLSRSGTEETLQGLRKTQYRNVTLAAGTKINAEDAYWDGTTNAGVPIPWVIIVDGGPNSCWYGSSYTGVWDDTSPDITWEEPYHHSGAMTIRMPNFLVEALRSHNQGDGIRMESGGSNFHIRGVYLSDMHDDCVENDANNAGVTEDSLFDGCYSGFSATNSNTSSDQGREWRIESNLVRMKPYMTVHNPQFFVDRGCEPAPNHMGLLKGFWEGKGPKVVLKNNIIKYDHRPCGTAPVIPVGMDLSECSNNIIVYTGNGEFPKEFPPECFTLTTDEAVWNNAVNSWKQNHPDASD